MNLSTGRIVSKEEQPDYSSGMNTFHKRSHFWGRLTLLSVIIASLMPPLYLSFVVGAHPGWDMVVAGIVGYAAFIGIMWILEPITYYPTLGIAGTYLAFLTGNIANMCLPCSSAAQKAIGAEVGSRKAELAGVFGIAIASLVNICVIVLVILGGTAIVSKIPTALEDAFVFVLPAIFGAVLGQFAFKTPLNGLIALGVGIVVVLSPIFGLIKIVVCVAITITVILYKEKLTEKKA